MRATPSSPACRALPSPPACPTSSSRSTRSRRRCKSSAPRRRELGDPHFETLLEFLQRERGFDFSGYKRPSLMRRVQRRMQLLGIDDFERYVEYLEVRPEEFAQLFNSILINVTAFFRDEAASDFLKSDVLSPLHAAKSPQGPVSVWSAGCATGQEVYSLAIVLAEALGAEIGRASCRERGW